MKRPDQDKFDMYARHYEKIDAKLRSYCEKNNCQLEINLLRQPFRVLRQDGNPEFLIDISLSGYWREVAFEENMNHDVTFLAYCEPPQSQFIWKLANELAVKLSFSILCDRLDGYLEEAFTQMNNLTPEIIMQKGERVENLKKKYGAQKPREE
jgi:hypothetical protein